VEQSRCLKKVVGLRTKLEKRVEHSRTKRNKIEPSRCLQTGACGCAELDTRMNAWSDTLSTPTSLLAKGCGSTYPRPTADSCLFVPMGVAKVDGFHRTRTSPPGHELVVLRVAVVEAASSVEVGTWYRNDVCLLCPNNTKGRRHGCVCETKRCESNELINFTIRSRTSEGYRVCFRPSVGGFPFGLACYYSLLK